MTTSETPVSKVAVVGAGTMGSGIAQVIAGAGIHVTLIDRGQEELDKGLESIMHSLTRMREKNVFTEQEVDAVASRISIDENLAAVESSQFVIEAVYEDFEIKSNLLGSISGITSPRSVIATNSSSLSVSRLAESVQKPERFLGMHFFNPAPILPLVEVVRTPLTDSGIIESAVEFAKSIGKTPVEVTDSPGFVVNRLVVPQIRTAITLLEEGVASRDAIDTAMQLGASHPMGPLKLADLIGLDVCLSIMQSMTESMPNECLDPPDTLISMIAEGKLGRKSGEGFYVYD